MKLSSISRRIKSAISEFQKKDYESCLLHCFPAIDKTAKLRYPKAGVGRRFESFLSDQFDIIAPIGLGSRFGKGCTFGGLSYERAIYNLARNALVHEGNLDQLLTINESKISVIGGNWALSDRNVLALIIAVVVAKENLKEYLDFEIEILLFNKRFSLNSLWGKEADLRSLISEVYNQSEQEDGERRG